MAPRVANEYVSDPILGHQSISQFTSKTLMELGFILVLASRQQPHWSVLSNHQNFSSVVFAFGHFLDA